MIAAQVEIGGVYTAKVSGRVVKVEIIAKHHLGGWLAKNLETGRTIRIKSGRRLRSRTTP